MLGGKKSDATRKSWKLFSTPPTLGGGRGGEGCSLPAAHQSGRSTILNISGNSLDLFINVLRVFLILTVHWGRRSAPHLWEGLDRPHCIRYGPEAPEHWSPWRRTGKENFYEKLQQPKMPEVCGKQLCGYSRQDTGATDINWRVALKLKVIHPFPYPR